MVARERRRASITASITAVRELNAERRAERRAELGRHPTRCSEQLAKCSFGFGAFCKRLVVTARSEHTVINLIKPPDDPEALQPAQMVQMFWNAQ